MHTELYSLSKLFTEHLFRIPDYQRGYSWTERQLKDFWSDISLLGEGGAHYTGVLTLEEVHENQYNGWHDDLWIIKKRGFKPHYVVDGQQRLTTSLILIQAILERIGPNGELNFSTYDDIKKKYIFESKDKGVSRSYIFGYERDNPSYEFLKTKIFMEASDDHNVGEDTIYTHNLLAAKKTFAAYLVKLSKDDLETIFTKITQHFLYNIYTIAKNIDVFVAFETMNNRGKPLSHLELLKNRLIYLSTRLDAEDLEKRKLRSVINESWKTAYHYLGRNHEAPLDDNAFLALHFILYIGPRIWKANDEDDDDDNTRYFDDEEEYKTYLLDELFTSKNIGPSAPAEVRLTVEYIYEYAHDLKRAVQLYYELMNPHDNSFSDEQRIWLARLNRCGWSDALPLAMAAAELRNNPSQSEIFSSFLAALERLLFLKQLVGYYAYDHELSLEQLALQLRTRKIDLNEIVVKLNANVDAFLKKVDFAKVFNEWTKRSGFYRWRHLRYFLFEYEQHLKQKAKADRDKLIWKEFARENYEKDYHTVEHIYPQRPKDNYWKAQFGKFSVKERNILKNSIGNFVPLSVAKNSSLGNKNFLDKKSGTEKTHGYKYGCYSEIEVAESQDWTAGQILSRGVRMLEFMEKRWRFSIGNAEAKKRALGLKFV